MPTARRFVAAALVVALACRDSFGTGETVPAVETFTVQAVSLVATRLEWTAVGGADVINYRIERRANFSGPFAVVAANVPQSDASTILYFDVGLEPDTYYGYRVTAQSRFGERATPSLVRAARTPPRPAVLVATSTALSTPTSVDQDGYWVMLRRASDSASIPIGPTGEVRFGPLTPGAYLVELRGVASQCGLAGAPLRAASVTDQGVSTVDTVRYVLACRDPGLGRLTVQAAVTGDSLDASGYAIQIVGTPSAPGPGDSIVSIHHHFNPSGGQQTFDVLKPGAYEVAIDSVAAHCVVAGSPLRNVAVAALSDDTVRYNIACQGSGGGGGTGPYVWRNTWSGSAVPANQRVSLDVALDLTADDTARVSAVEAQLRFDSTVLRYDSATARSLGQPTVNLQASGTLLWNAFTLGAPQGGLVPLVRLHFTAVGANGATAATRTVVDVVADADLIEIPDSLFRVVEDTVAVGAGGANQPPNAAAGGPYSGTAGTSIAFSATGSTDPDGTIASYSWTFGDGGSATGATPSHVYAAAGNYTATLTVTDNQGGTDTDQASVTVTGTGPTTPFTWAGSFGAVNPVDSVVALTLTLDLTTDIVDTPGTEQLATVVVDSLKWNPAVLRYHAFNWGPGGAGVVNPTDALTLGKLVFSSFTLPAGSNSGVIAVATIRFKVIGSSASSTTTATRLGPLTGTPATGSYAYRPRTSVQEAAFVVP